MQTDIGTFVRRQAFGVFLRLAIGPLHVRSLVTVTAQYTRQTLEDNELHPRGDFDMIGAVVVKLEHPHSADH